MLSPSVVIGVGRFAVSRARRFFSAASFAAGTRFAQTSVTGVPSSAVQVPTTRPPATTTGAIQPAARLTSGR